VLALFVLAGTYATPMLLAHALGAPSVRVAIFIDDERRDPPANYFLSVKIWGVCLRIEWLDNARGSRLPS
jgi:hypothetical protein